MAPEFEWIRNTSECKIQANYSIKKIKVNRQAHQFYSLFLQDLTKRSGNKFTNKRYNKTGSERICERCERAGYTAARFANWHISKKKLRRNVSREIRLIK